MGSVIWSISILGKVAREYTENPEKRPRGGISLTQSLHGADVDRGRDPA